jgi:hypothetical protein
MPTELSAQNGQVFKQATQIKVSGCTTPKQRLAKELKQCRKKQSKAKRKSCEAKARRRFRAAKKRG